MNYKEDPAVSGTEKDTTVTIRIRQREIHLDSIFLGVLGYF